MSAPEWQRLEIDAISLEDLARIRAFVHDALVSESAEDVSDAAVLVVDEVCANLVMHGYSGGPPGRVRVGVCIEPDMVRLEVEDEGHPFHPDSAPQPDLTTDIETRHVGGLGWFLVRQLMDECTYDVGSGFNRLTLAKRRGLSASGASGNTTLLR
jgi:serine/threonine-protein kinase RsbW